MNMKEKERLAKEHNIKFCTLDSRLRFQGLSLEEALNRPVRDNKRPIVWDGIEYPTKKNLAKAYGMNEKILYRINSVNTLEKIIYGRKSLAQKEQEMRKIRIAVYNKNADEITIKGKVRNYEFNATIKFRGNKNFLCSRIKWFELSKWANDGRLYYVARYYKVWDESVAPNFDDEEIMYEILDYIATKNFDEAGETDDNT